MEAFPDLYKGTEIALNILNERYLKRNEKGVVVETPRDLFMRVAKYIASADLKWAGDPDKTAVIFYRLMATGDFEPNTPCLANAGYKDSTGQFSACFVVPVPDDMRGIMAALTSTALIHQSGGGTGFDFSKLRPDGDYVRSTTGHASGPVSFMAMFNNSTQVIKQSGIRRGANMGILRVDHPDILQFIDCKKTACEVCAESGKKTCDHSIRNFNISVALTDTFMEALTKDTEYGLVNPRSGLTTSKLRAKDVWEKIINNAWFSGEPGAFFVDRVNRLDPLSELLGPIAATNPCVSGDTLLLTRHGEQPVESLIGQDVEIWNGKEWSMVQPRVTGTNERMLRVELRGGRSLTCTFGHTFHLNDGTKVSAEGLRIGDVLEEFDLPDGGWYLRRQRDLRVQSVVACGIARQVFCFTEPKRHRGVFNGILTGNCGEVPLRSYDACTLGSINLNRFYAEKNGKGTIDFERLKHVVHHGVHFLDNVLEVNTYPIPEIREVTSKCRKIGLGVMGWADLLINLGIPYDSTEALSLAEEVMKFVNTSAIEKSEELAERRAPFHHWEGSSWKKKGDKPRRNSTVTVIAPTGSISIIAGCNFSIEPLYALVMVRDQAGMKQIDVNQAFVKAAKQGGWYSDALMERIAKRKGSCQGLDEVPENIQQLFKVANDIDVECHIKMQAAFQKHTEDAVSKTVNARKSTTVAEIEQAYLLAWSEGCKGITVYRDGSRSKQVLSAGTDTDGAEVIIRRNLKSIPKVKGVQMRRGWTMTVGTPYGSVHVTINEHPSDGEPFECFVSLGKSGTETKALSESLGRVTSQYLAAPGSAAPREILKMVAEQFIGIGGGGQFGVGPDKVVSAPDGIAKAILHYLASTSSEPSIVDEETGAAMDICPDCQQATLAKGAGCDLCEACGYSSC